MQFQNESEDQKTLSGGGFVPTKKVVELRDRLMKFMQDHIYPMESEFYKLANSSRRWTVHPEEEKLKDIAKKQGLWNLWLPVCQSSSIVYHVHLQILCILFPFRYM